MGRVSRNHGALEASYRIRGKVSLVYQGGLPISPSLRRSSSLQTLICSSVCEYVRYVKGSRACTCFRRLPFLTHSSVCRCRTRRLAARFRDQRRRVVFTTAAPKPLAQARGWSTSTRTRNTTAIKALESKSRRTGWMAL
jgi:hypothetical protein